MLWRIAQVLVHLIPLSYLVVYYYWAFTDQLGGDPVKAIIHFSGIGALNLLLLSLVISPLAKKFKQGKLMKWRRPLGLWAFSYALAHFINYLLFDLQLDFSLLGSEIIKRPYITIGFIALLILVSLAVTSVPEIKKRMGKRWQQLHNYVYLLIILAGIHFYWSVKSEIIEPSIYLALIFLLLWLRRQKFRRR